MAASRSRPEHPLPAVARMLLQPSAREAQPRGAAVRRLGVRASCAAHRRGTAATGSSPSLVRPGSGVPLHSLRPCMLARAEVWWRCVSLLPLCAAPQASSSVLPRAPSVGASVRVPPRDLASATSASASGCAASSAVSLGASRRLARPAAAPPRGASARLVDAVGLVRPCSRPATRFLRRPSGWLRGSRRRSRVSWRTRPRSFSSFSSPGRRPERASSSSCVTGERSSSRRGSRRLRSHATRAGRRRRGARRSTSTRSSSSRTGTETPLVASASRTSSAG